MKGDKSNKKIFSIFQKGIDKNQKLKFIDDVDLNLFNYLTNE